MGWQKWSQRNDRHAVGASVTQLVRPSRGKEPLGSVGWRVLRAGEGRLNMLIVDRTRLGPAFDSNGHRTPSRVPIRPMVQQARDRIVERRACVDVVEIGAGDLVLFCFVRLEGIDHLRDRERYVAFDKSVNTTNDGVDLDAALLAVAEDHLPRLWCVEKTFEDISI